MKSKIKRKFPIGAEIIPNLGVHFRIWAPDHKKVELVIEKGGAQRLFVKMKSEKNGYFSVLTDKAKEGTHYSFKLSNSQRTFPDPASRYQPFGPMGSSSVINPHFPWKDKQWRGVGTQGHVIYELHIGTFTEEGTFASATKEIPRLKELGITLIEMMPVADFIGHFGWGYDGVNHFAPSHLYGKPNDLKEFINQAHLNGMGVILDVVYNHLGPEGNSITQFSKDYLSEEYKTDWGKAINFDHPESRNYFLTNADYWIEEFHFDGLRIDATPLFFSSTSMHILEDLSRVVKKKRKRKTIIIGENEPQNTKLLRSYREGGYGFDMLWNDDFHHSAYVRLTGKREAYCTDYLGAPQEFLSSVKYGFLYQGQYYNWQKKTRGISNFKLPPESFINFLENHDQVANMGGKRIHQKSDYGNYKALVALLLLSPNTPLIFQGQEFNSTQPFHYFSDHSPELGILISKGRKKELSQFPTLATFEASEKLPDPENPSTFTRSKLQQKDLSNGTQMHLLFSNLIKLRQNDPVFKKMQQIKIDGAVLGNDCFILRYFGEKEGDRLLIINFGSDYEFNPAPEPLLAPNEGNKLELEWSSESVQYGGEGTPPINIPFWKLLGHSAIVLKTEKTV